MNRFTIPAVLLLAVAVAACDTDVTNSPAADGPIADVFRQASDPATLRSLDAAFDYIAGEIPGFGGLFYDETGRPNVYMRPVSGATPLSTEALAAQLNDRLLATGLDATVSARDLIVRPGDWDFQQLRRFHRDVSQVLSSPGVVFTDADEATNRIVIGVEAGTSVAEIQAQAEQLGVPAGALSVVTTEPVVPLAQAAPERLGPRIEALSPTPLNTNIGGLPTLRDAIRPIAGGLQIWRFIPPGNASICSLGFNAAAPTFSQGRLFFTNSHCTEVRGEVTGTTYMQKQLAFPLEPVAIEVEDPPFFTNVDNPDCPAGRFCRYSDAAAAEYIVPNEDVASSRIMAPFPGTLTLPSASSTFRVAGEATTRAIVGQGLMKVGRTSGMTGAAVIGTCQNTGVAGTVPMTMLCQDRVAIDAIGGDSGSPVFEAMDNRPFMDATPNQRVRIHGLLWGGSGNTYVFSSMINIRMEFPGPWVVH